MKIENKFELIDKNEIKIISINNDFKNLQIKVWLYIKLYYIYIYFILFILYIYTLYYILLINYTFSMKVL